MVQVTRIGPDSAEILNTEFKQTPNAFMAVTHPDCGHCKDMKPALENFYENLKDYSGDVGIFDIHADAISGSRSTIPQLNSVNGFPTLIITKNNKSDPITYNGNRTTDDMLKFCLKNMNLEKITNTIKGGKKRTKKTRRRKNKRKRQTRKRRSRRR
jgi:thiol-disulfide isomerase/thioredoxin